MGASERRLRRELKNADVYDVGPPTEGGGGVVVGAPVSFVGAREPKLFGGGYTGGMNGEAMRFQCAEASWVTVTWNNASSNPGGFTVWVGPTQLEAAATIQDRQNISGNFAPYSTRFLVPAGYFYDIATNGSNTPGQTTVFAWAEYPIT